MLKSVIQKAATNGIAEYTTRLSTVIKNESSKLSGTGHKRPTHARNKSSVKIPKGHPTATAPIPDTSLLGHVKSTMKMAAELLTDPRIWLIFVLILSVFAHYQFLQYNKPACSTKEIIVDFREWQQATWSPNSTPYPFSHMFRSPDLNETSHSLSRAHRKIGSIRGSLQIAAEALKRADARIREAQWLEFGGRAVISCWQEEENSNKTNCMHMENELWEYSRQLKYS